MFGDVLRYRWCGLSIVASALASSAVRADPADAPMPMEMEHGPTMPMRGVLDLPMSRIGSGTSWLPDDTPMRAFHFMIGSWDFMVHGNLQAGPDIQGGETGDTGVVSQNWIMGMAGHELGPGRVTGRTMLSLEPFTVGKHGYPELGQTGETYQGMPLVDRQHPHDLFMEVAAIADEPIGDDLAIQGYAALSGEPALGPTAFPHRPSAIWDPMAPLSHHWLDSTHISFGVTTLGVYNRWGKLEASWFNGREPDENRLDFDLRGFDSYSARATINPSRAWSGQVSYGYLASPEALHPDESDQRITASVTHVLLLRGRDSLISTIAWGQNRPNDPPSGPDRASNAVLVESALDLDDLGVTFLRGEYVQKRGEDFGLPAQMADVHLPVAELAIGHVHPLPAFEDLAPAIGARGSALIIDPSLESRYGTRYPLGAMVYLQIQPAQMR